MWAEADVLVEVECAQKRLPGPWKLYFSCSRLVGEKGSKSLSQEEMENIGQTVALVPAHLLLCIVEGKKVCESTAHGIEFMELG